MKNNGEKADEATGRPALHLLDTIIIAFIFLSVCLGHLSSQFNFDGTVFAFRVEKAAAGGGIWELFHPRHIFYEPAGYIFYSVAHALGPALRSIVWLEIMDAVFGAAALCLFHRLALRMGMSRVTAAGLTMCLAFSFGFWFFSVESEVYVPGVFFLLLGFRCLCYFMDRGKHGVGAAGLLGVLAALAMANHIVNGLFLIPLVFGALFFLKKAEPKNDSGFSLDIPAAVMMAAVCFAFIFLVYYEAGTHSSLAKEMGAKKWFLGLADPETPFGYRKSYWVLHHAALWHWVLGTAKTFFAAGSHRLFYNAFLGFLVCMAAAIIVILWGIYFLRLRKASAADIKLHLLLWLWLAPYAIFTVIWEPKNFELKVFFLAPLFLLLGLGLKGLKGKVRVIRISPALLAALLFITNFYSSILPGADEKNNIDLQRAYFIRDHTEPLAIIYIAGVSGGYNKGKIYIPYFSQRQAVVMDWRLERMIKDGGRIELDIGPDSYVLHELIATGDAVDQLAKNHETSSNLINAAFLRYRLRTIARHDEDFVLYRVLGPR